VFGAGTTDLRRARAVQKVPTTPTRGPFAAPNVGTSVSPAFRTQTLSRNGTPPVWSEHSSQFSLLFQGFEGESHWRDVLESAS
jgi:hypothetical protein